MGKSILLLVSFLFSTFAFAGSNQSSLDSFLRRQPSIHINCGEVMISIYGNLAHVNGNEYSWMAHPVSKNWNDGFTFTIHKNHSVHNVYSCHL